MSDEPQPTRLRLSLRGMLIVTAWLSFVMTMFVGLRRLEVLTISWVVYLLVHLAGAMGGTLYGVWLNRPEKNRWIRAYLWSVCFGYLLGLMGFGTFGPVDLLLTMLVAVLAASLTEMLRMLVQQFR